MPRKKSVEELQKQIDQLKNRQIALRQKNNANIRKAANHLKAILGGLVMSKDYGFDYCDLMVILEMLEDGKSNEKLKEQSAKKRALILSNADNPSFKKAYTSLLSWDKTVAKKKALVEDLKKFK